MTIIYIILAFMLGSWFGHSVMIILIKRNIKSGRMFVKGKDNKWMPFNPFREAK